MKKILSNGGLSCSEKHLAMEGWFSSCIGDGHRCYPSIRISILQLSFNAALYLSQSVQDSKMTWPTEENVCYVPQMTLRYSVLIFTVHRTSVSFLTIQEHRDNAFAHSQAV